MKKAILVSVAAAGAVAATFWPPDAASHNPVITTVTFNREIASLFERKCLQCHTEDGMAMPLGTYAEARPWAVAIKEEILARRMPPWPAERGYGEFANDVGLTTREFDFLISWVDGGVPKGTGNDPRYDDHHDHWMLGDPDVRRGANAGTTVEAGSPARFTRVLIDTGFNEDKWIRALDFKPGDRRVARAAFFSIAETGQYLGGWTPWHSTTELPQGVAFRIPARSRIAIDVLYRGASQSVVDKPSLAFYYAATRAPTAPIKTTNLVLQSPSAVTAAQSRRARAELMLTADSTLLSLRPELSAEGKSIEVKARRPDGSVQILLWVKNFSQEWQTPYLFRQPIALPKGSLIQVAAYAATSNDRLRPQFTVTFNAYEDR